METYREIVGSSRPKSKTSNFELVKEIGQDVWIAVRLGDPRGEQYLARSITDYQGFPETRDASLDEQEGTKSSAWLDLLRRGNQASTVAQVLNHENIISLVGRIDTQLFTKTQQEDSQSANSKSYLVWDFCDAANLSTVFGDHPVRDSAYYLPESLCWHVLVSLSRAVAYLHDGTRIRFHEDRNSAPPEWEPIDHDWLPILHRAIEPGNIYFQHPRGTETYGQCKLGNFRHATVTNHDVGESLRESWDQNADIGTSASKHRGHELFNETLQKYQQDPEDYSENKRPYTLGTELWSIGAVIFTMMTGRYPTYCCQYCGCCHIERCKKGGCLQRKAEANGCRCRYGGCEHIPKEDCVHGGSKWKPCPHSHHCSQRMVNIDTYLARTKYSKMLVQAVALLLYHDPKCTRRNAPWRAVPLSQQVESEYKRWKDTTNEGKEYRDIDDDMEQRREAVKKQV